MFRAVLSNLLDTCVGVESYGKPMSSFLRTCQTFPQRLQHFTFLPATHEASKSPTDVYHFCRFVRFCSLMAATLIGVRRCLVVAVTCISPSD